MFEALNEAVRRLPGLDLEKEFLQNRSRALNLDAYSLRGVGDKTVQLQAGGQSVNEGTETHPLYRAVNNDPEPLHALAGVLHDFHRAFRQRLQKRFAVLLGQNPVVQDHNDSGVGLGAN